MQKFMMNELSIYSKDRISITVFFPFASDVTVAKQCAKQVLVFGQLGSN